MHHDADTPGRDHVETKRTGFAPSVAVGLGTSTRAILSYFRLKQDNVPDYGIPFVPSTNVALPDHHEQPAPVDYDNYYGLLERDYEDTLANIATFALEHDLTPDIRIANTTRYGHATRNSIYSSPRFAILPIRRQPGCWSIRKPSRATPSTRCCSTRRTCSPSS